MLEGSYFQFFDALFFLYAIPIIVVFYFLYDSYRARKLRAYASSQILPNISILASTKLTLMRRLLIMGAWVFATFALMQPIGNPHYLYAQLFPSAEKDKRKMEQNPSREIIFLLDASTSMLAQDTRKGTSRFDNAKELIDAITSKLYGKRVSLYAFTTELIPIVPATNDLLFLRMLTKSTTINPKESAGTDFFNTFSSLSKRWSEESINAKRILIILSDGDDTSLENLTDHLREQREAKILSPFSHLNNDLYIEAIGIGSEKGAVVPGIEYKGKSVISRMNTQFLNKISENRGGKLFLANRETPSRIAAETETLMESYATQEQTLFTQSQDFLVYEHYFQYPLVLALLFLGLAKLIPEPRKTN